MTEAQQAKKLINRFKGCAHGEIGSEQLFKNSRKCALICADEIIKSAAYMERLHWINTKKEILKSTHNGR